MSCRGDPLRNRDDCLDCNDCNDDGNCIADNPKSIYDIGYIPITEITFECS